MSTTTHPVPASAIPIIDVFRDMPDIDMETVLAVLHSRPDMHDQAMAIAAHAIVAQVRGAERSRMIAAAPIKARPLDANPHMARMAARVTLYDYVLPHAPIKLGDATADDLETAALYHATRSRAEATRAAMFERIRSAMGSRAGSVRAVMDEKTLAEAMMP